MTKQIVEVFNFLYQNNVKYFVIGGFAVNLYGYSRNTGDLDICIDESLQNRKHLRKALIAVGIGDLESIETMQFVAGWTEIQLDFGVKLDLMSSIKGLEHKTFDELYAISTIVLFDETPVNFIDYENLIVSKKAANRPKDILDIQELFKLNPENLQF